MGSGGGGGGGSDTQTNYVRYAAYVESRHKNFLSVVASQRKAILTDSPFQDYEVRDFDELFFSAGKTISSFPALFDTHKTLLFDFGPDHSFRSTFDEMLQGNQIRDLVNVEGQLLDDQIEQVSNPRIMVGARDINSVQSSTFVIAKSVNESARTKQLAKFSAELKYRMIPVVLERWKARLAWNQNAVQQYSQLIKFYLSADMDYTEQKYTLLAKNKLWPFTVSEYERAALGALQGARTTTSKIAGTDAGAGTAQKAISGVLGGASMGATVGSAIPGVGTVIGGAVGAIVGLGASLL